MSWLLGNIESLLAVAGSVVMSASLITSLTPTPADDKIVGRLYKIIEWLSFNFGKSKMKSPNSR